MNVMFIPTQQVLTINDQQESLTIILDAAITRYKREGKINKVESDKAILERLVTGLYLQNVDMMGNKPARKFARLHFKIVD